MALTPKQRKAALEKGLTVELATSDDKKYMRPNPTAATKLFAPPAGEKPESESLPADPPIRQTVDRQYYRQTGSRKPDDFSRENESKIAPPLPADSLPVVEDGTTRDTILLAPVQWVVWQELQKADIQDHVVSYRKLARIAKASIRGIRDAFSIIEKEGGIRSKETVRTSDEQGLRVHVNTQTLFRLATLNETKGLLKRRNYYRQTVDRQSPVLPTDGLRMYVSNGGDRHTYSTTGRRSTGSEMENLLRILPVSWEIREGTLVSVTREFPHMTPLEFRRSLSYLVEQAKNSRQTIQNHNAWLRAAFTKNGGPLVTERMLEAQIDGLKQDAKVVQGKGLENTDTLLQLDFDALRRYLVASPQEKEAIDRMSQEKAAAALRMVPKDKHADILQQALIESARAYFSKSGKPVS